jgi:hypothetical protein
MVVYFEAHGSDQLGALAQHMRTTPRFPVLHSMKLLEERDERDEGECPHLASIAGLLAKGRAPGLEKLKLTDCTIGDASLASLGQAISQGSLPALSLIKLGFHSVGPQGFQALIAGLQSHVGLRRLEIAFWEAPQYSTVTALASGKAGSGGGGSGLYRLEELEMKYGRFCWDPVLEALGSGDAPCACATTLKVLTIGEDACNAEGFLPLFQGLGSGALPSLTSLHIEFRSYSEYTDDEFDDDDAAMEAASLQELIQALLKLARNGTPSRLDVLKLGSEDLQLDWLEELTQVFAVGALPRLIDLWVSNPKGIRAQVEDERELDDEEEEQQEPVERETEAAFLESWTALGSMVCSSCQSTCPWTNACRFPFWSR